MELNDFWGLLGVPFIAAIVSLFKPWVPDKRYYPIIAVVLGIVLNVGLAVNQGHSVVLGLLLGIVVGLSASGLYSAQKTLRK